MKNSLFSPSEVSMLLDEIKIGILLIEGDNHIAYANPWFLNAAGITDKTIQGRTLEEVFPELKSKRLVGAITEALEARRSALLTSKLNKNLFPLHEPNGSEMFQRITLGPFGEGEKSPRCLIQIEDITDAFEREKILRQKRNETESDRAHLNAILQGSAEGIITIDQHGEIETFNTAAENIFGYSAHEVIGQNAALLMSAAERHLHYGYLKNSKLVEPRIINNARDLIGQHKNENLFPIELNVSKVKIAGRIVFIGIIRDITEQKEVARLKNEFVSTVSHELRTPLTSIKGALGLLAISALGKLPDEAKNLLDIAERNSNRLINLVNDILDIEGMDAGGVEFVFEPLDLSILVAEAIKSNAGLAEQHNVEFVLNENVPETWVKGVENRLIQVMANLLSNAAKFSPAGEKVEVSVTRQNDTVQVSISDHGPGVPKKFQDHLFERFTQADGSDTRQKSGSGLGLNITKRIIEKHSGEIGFNTQAGVGTTFYFTLPIGK